MSGGDIGHQDSDDDRQVVIFTFSGKLRPEDVTAWNTSIKALMQRFNVTSTSVAGVTIVGGAKSKP
jgi:hypothetical protein